MFCTDENKKQTILDRESPSKTCLFAPYHGFQQCFLRAVDETLFAFQTYDQRNERTRAIAATQTSPALQREEREVSLRGHFRWASASTKVVRERTFATLTET